MTFELGDFLAEELIGVGGSAQVWRGRRISTGAPVALKVFAPDGLAAARREAALAAAVNHPHVVTVLDVVADSNRVALITELADGGNLAGLLDRRRMLGAGETLTVLLPLAAALATAHERQIVHGDLSAANVIFDKAGRPLLADLGAGRAAVELSIPVATTACDAAPELARGGPPTAASDMFSLGSLALACLTGRHAWPADDLRDVMIQAAAGQWPDLADDAAPAALVAIVRTLLQHDPERRPGAASVVMDLRGVGRPEPISFPGPLSPREPTAPSDSGALPDSGLVAESDRSGRHAGALIIQQSPERPERARSASADVSGPAPRSDQRHGQRPSSDAGGPRSAKGRPIRGWGESEDGDTARNLRSRAITRVRPVGTHRAVAAPAGRRSSARLARTSILALCCVLLVAAACATGLWWAGMDRTDPIAAGPVLAASTAAPPTATAVDPRRTTAPSPDVVPIPAASARSRSAPTSPTLTRSQVSSARVLPEPAPRATAATATSVPATPGSATPQSTLVDWTAIVRQLDRARAKALVARDPSLLAVVYTADSAARSADVRVIATLVSAGLRVSGAQHLVRDAHAAGGASILVTVHDSLPSYSIMNGAGSVVGTTAARPSASRVLVLERTASGYRISAVRSS